MSEAVEFEADSADSFERPGAEMDKLRGPIPNVDELALEDINPVSYTHLTLPTICSV